MVIVCEFTGCDLAEDDAEGKDIGREVKLVTKEDLGGHVGIGTAKSEALGFLFVSCGDASESKVCDLEATICRDEEILALEVAVDALAGMEVSEGARDIGGE